jgi:imidazoleglycerol-phosphate dehydratase|tara:strand:- start:124 stop:711 length:588 start_codon:yes stop_codon:yes gene_type:complete
MRKEKHSRKTNETDISVQMNVDGSGVSEIDTGIDFFNHMLDQLAKHSLIDLKIKAKGDINIDYHHTVEDVGICLGETLNKCVGDKKGIHRFASVLLPMDDALIQIAIDFSGRPYLFWDVNFPTSKVGNFDTELFSEFFRSFTMNACINLHIKLIHGINSHHIGEAIFKGVAQSLKNALSIDPRKSKIIPSTKGSL